MSCMTDSDRVERGLGSEVTKHKCIHHGIAMCSPWLQPPCCHGCSKVQPWSKSNTRSPVIKPAWPHTTFKIGIGPTFDLSLNKPTLKSAGLLLKALLIYSGFQYPSPLPPFLHCPLRSTNPRAAPSTSPPSPRMPVVHRGER